MDVVYIADEQFGRLGEERLAVDVVCAGDSITGWNNYGPAELWPFPTYTRFLQRSCTPLDLRIADGGIAGEVSNNGPALVRRYRDLFPNSRYFIIGYGTNDLASRQPVEELSQRIISNMDSMVKAVCEHGKQPILFNVPYVRESSFSFEDAAKTHHMRDYHNVKLQEYCDGEGIPLVDICWHLRDEHFGDEIHPNALGARIIAERVFDALSRIHQASDGKLVE
jgi:lysophospholipase L1-like esterase